MKYLSGECENTEVVIEENLRESLFNYLDNIAHPTFLLLNNLAGIVYDQLQ